MNAVIRSLGLCACLWLSTLSWAQDQLVTLPTREGQSISYWWMPGDGAKTTVLLFSGGSGGIGLRDGRPQARNFLIRSGEYFRTQGLNVAMMGNPSDKRQLDDAWRTSAMHRADVNLVLTDLRQRGSQALWLVGTSRGSVSVAALGIAMQEQLAGLVLTSSIASYSVATSVPQQAIDQIRLPVLVYHHKHDACRITLARDTEWIMRGLKNAPIKKRWIVEGGGNPEGDPCEALHWHGFIGMEEQAVKDIAGWIAKPQSD
ncbi:MAG: alpha/beta hydrolase [Betaproteobacteria bacterium]